MKIFHSRNPYHLISEFKEPRLLNFAGDDDGKDSGSHTDGDDEPSQDTPAGKKFAELRTKLKEKEEALKEAHEARIKAEAAAEAAAKVRQQYEADGEGSEKKAVSDPNEDDDISVHESDRKVIEKVAGNMFKGMGLEEITKTVKELQRATQESQLRSELNSAKTELEKEFDTSVPFNYEETLKYAKENGFGLLTNNVKQALKLAHKEMNEEKFVEFYKGGSEKKKKAPKMAASGRASDDELIEIGDDTDKEFEVSSFEDARKRARELTEEE